MNYSVCNSQICHLFSNILTLLSWIDVPGADSNRVILKGQGNIIQCEFIWDILTRQGRSCVQKFHVQVQKGHSVNYGFIWYWIEFNPNTAEIVGFLKLVILKLFIL